MKFLPFFFILIYYTIQNSGFTNGFIKNFDTFVEVNIERLTNENGDIHPTVIEGDDIEDFVFNIGKNTKTKCNRNAIACIKFKGDDIFYSVSSAESWSPKQIGTNISFVSSTIANLTLPIGVGDKKLSDSKYVFQLEMSFTDSQESEIRLIYLSSVSLLLIISNPNLKQFVFDYISLFCDEYKLYISIVLICSGLFIIIP